MTDDGCAYFIGAGASKQDRFPLTSELKHGIASALVRERSRFDFLTTHLQYLYGVDDASVHDGANKWSRLQRGEPQPDAKVSPIPDVTDLLSTLDWIIREQSSFGPGPSNNSARSSGGDLPRVRDLVVQALCYCLGTYADLNAASTTREFVRTLRPSDSLITTNWDLLLDSARDAFFGSEAGDYGTTGNVVLEHNAEPKEGRRPRLLKLHGSLSWRYCQRCQRLVIDPSHHVAGEREERAVCDCTCPFSELIVTPGFVREYRNVHLLTIWREALMTLFWANKWVFIGYSLPADDVGIRTLLLKARCMRHDVGSKPPLVTVVTGRDGRDATLNRYRGILPQAELDPDDFGHFVRRAGRSA